MRPFLLTLFGAIAILPAIMLVRARFVQSKRIEEARTGLRNDCDMRIVENSADESHRARVVMRLTQRRPGSA